MIETLVTGGHCVGKTTKLLSLSQASNAPMVSLNKSGCSLLKRYADDYGMSIPEPLSYRQLLSLPKEKKPTFIIVDEADLMLWQLTGCIVKAAGMSAKSIHLGRYLDADMHFTFPGNQFEGMEEAE